MSTLNRCCFKKLALLFIKYTPGIMALTCSVKIFLLGIDSDLYFSTNKAVNVINLLLEVFIIFGVYCLGRTFNYCWKHRSLCRAALLGYINYGLFILNDIKSELLIPITIAYIVLVLIMGVVYYEDR